MRYTEFNEYFKTLAAEHQEIDVFFRMENNEMDDSLKAIPLNGRALVLDEYDGSIKEDGKGEYLDTQKCVFMILGKHNRKNQTRDQHEAEMDKLKSIGLQIFARMFFDARHKAYCPSFLKHLKKDINYYFTPWYSGHVRGWYFEFTLVDKSSEMVYDASKWGSES